MVAPRDSDDLSATLAICHTAGTPVTVRGAGTSVAGNACGPGVLIDTTRHLTAFLDFDREAGTATVEPGIVLDDVNREVGTVGMRVGPDPSTHSRCTVGGMVGNNACGPHSVRWGTTADNVVSLSVALADGTRMTLGTRSSASRASVVQPREPEDRIEASVRELLHANLPLIREELKPWSRRGSGYALDWLLPERGFDLAKALVGTEGTCAVVLAITLRLVVPPAERMLLVLGFGDEVAAAQAVPPLLAERPLTVEGVTADLFGVAEAGLIGELLPSGRAWLLVETGGESAAEARDHGRALAAALGRTLSDSSLRLLESKRQQAELWRVREEGAGRATRLPDGSAAWPGLEDAAVPPERLAAYLSAFRGLLDEHSLHGTVYGHFGEGCIHVRIGFGLDRPGGVERLRAFMREGADLVVAHGGSLSGEHGDGRARSELLPRMFSAQMLGVFRQFKAIWDPSGILNPGIVVDPVPLDRNLWPAAATLVRLETNLAFRGDGGNFRTAVERCVGIGKCVSHGSPGLMCPSYRATGNERDSTRGRARLLQEMITGDLAPAGWRSKEIRDALDLCLACKGCLSECPTGVDMASYKAEFLAHHYRRRVRPRSHYSLGWLPLWLRLTQRVPRLVNWFMGNGVTGRLFALAGGIEAGQMIPPLPRESFVRSYSRSQGPRAGHRVILWPDTFNNYLTPNVSKAAANVLTAAGFDVRVPRTSVCCGLTWVTTGQLDCARRVLRRTLRADELAGDDPVVVLEPSCATALRTDLPELLPLDPLARSLAARITTLAEILDGAGFTVAGRSPRSALVQPHCHQQAVLGVESDRRVLERSGIRIETMLTGCCGLAGNFGAERGHRDVSRAVAELDLLPALRQTPQDTLILADGFSCRTQIEALTGRHAVHLAEVLVGLLEDPARRPRAPVA